MSDQDLLRELESLKRENADLKQQLKKKAKITKNEELSLEEYSRYGRQMIVDITGGVQGQLKLKNSKVLVIGAGGLGCPVLPYLAGAGVGSIGIVDDDIVDTSNLHRQVLHDTNKVGMLKCDSVKEVLNRLNPHINIETYPVRLNNSNAYDIFMDYDVVIDCTDTPLTRYLISDVAVHLGITVVSGSGLGTEGQLCILNYKNKSPCYRCFYPEPPPPTSVASCSEGGVIGPCIGIVGLMMAVETLKVLLEYYTIDKFQPFILSYSGFPHQSVRKFTMRGRQGHCKTCGENPSVTKEAVLSNTINYASFCGSRNYDVCEPDERISVYDFERDYYNSKKAKTYILLDVRPSHHHDISHFRNTINIPVKQLRDMEGDFEQLQSRIPELSPDSEIVVICRHGNDSRLATRILKDDFGLSKVRDVQGGFFKYIDEINPSIPKY